MAYKRRCWGFRPVTKPEPEENGGSVERRRAWRHDMFAQHAHALLWQVSFGSGVGGAVVVWQLVRGESQAAGGCARARQRAQMRAVRFKAVFERNVARENRERAVRQRCARVCQTGRGRVVKWQCAAQRARAARRRHACARSHPRAEARCATRRRCRL